MRRFVLGPLGWLKASSGREREDQAPPWRFVEVPMAVLKDLIEALLKALSPAPQAVPVPIPVRVNEGRRRR